MMEQQRLDGLLEELEESAAMAEVIDQGVHIPGIGAMLVELHEAMRQLMGLPHQNPRGILPSQFIPTHYILGSSGLTECCGRPLFELPRSHRVTTHPELTMCGEQR